MELRRYLLILRQRLALVVVTVLVALTIAWLVTPRTPLYQASATIFVGSRQFSEQGDTRNLSLDRLSALDRVLLTYSIMIDSPPVASDAIERLGLARSAEAVTGQTTTRPLTGTQLLEISVVDRDPTIARDLANAVASAFVDAIQAYEGSSEVAQVGDLPTGLPAYVYDEANLPTAPRPTPLVNNLILGLLFGLLLAGGLVFAIDYLDVTVRSPLDAERRLGLPVLGVIPVIENPGDLPNIVRRTARSTRPREAARA